MKTNAVKTVIVAVAISFALTSCENDTLNELETEKATIDQVKPIDNHYHRNLEVDFEKELSLPKKDFLTPSIQNGNRDDQNLILDETKKNPVQKKNKEPLNRPFEKKIEFIKE